MALPFEEELEPPAKIISFPGPAPEPAAEPRPARESRVARSVPEPQAGLDFQSAALEQPWQLRPVAPLAIRVRGHLRDLQFIAGGLLLFLLTFAAARWMGVQIIPKPILLAGLSCGSLLLALLYGALFLWGAGATPGMRSVGLHLMNFDGKPASRRQRLWRFLGAVVSGGSFLIGFLWAVVDEEKLYWHDHISKTYLTTADS